MEQIRQEALLLVEQMRFPAHHNEPLTSARAVGYSSRATRPVSIEEFDQVIRHKLDVVRNGDGSGIVEEEEERKINETSPRKKEEEDDDDDEANGSISNAPPIQQHNNNNNTIQSTTTTTNAPVMGMGWEAFSMEDPNEGIGLNEAKQREDGNGDEDVVMRRTPEKVQISALQSPPPLPSPPLRANNSSVFDPNWTPSGWGQGLGAKRKQADIESPLLVDSSPHLNTTTILPSSSVDHKLSDKECVEEGRRLKHAAEAIKARSGSPEYVTKNLLLLKSCVAFLKAERSRSDFAYLQSISLMLNLCSAAFQDCRKHVLAVGSLACLTLVQYSIFRASRSNLKRLRVEAKDLVKSISPSGDVPQSVFRPFKELFEMGEPLFASQDTLLKLKAMLLQDTMPSDVRTFTAESIFAPDGFARCIAFAEKCAEYHF